MNGKTGVQISDYNLKLEIQQPLNNELSIYLDFGQIQKQPGEIHIDFYYSSPKELQMYTGDNFEQILEYDKFLNNYIFIGSDIINSNFTPNEIIQQYLPQLSSLLNKDQLNGDNIRLREKIGNKLQKVYKDIPLKAQQIRDRKALAFELIDHSTNDNPFYKSLTYSEYLIQFSYYDPEDQTLGQFHELIVSNQINYDQLNIQISKILGLKIDFCGTVINKLINFTRFLLFEAKWVNFNQNHKKLIESPLELQSDGKLIIVKDSLKSLKELSSIEMALIQKHLWKENIHYNLL